MYTFSNFAKTIGTRFNKSLDNNVNYSHDGDEYIFNNVYLNDFLNIKGGEINEK